jgi:hypothetical protein
MDSDGQHNPKDIGRLLQDIEKYEMIVGARSQGSQSPLWRLPGKWILSRLVNYLVNEKIPDFNCGFRAAKRNILIKYLHLCPDGFSFSTTLTLAFFCQGRQVKFVPIKVNRRTISRSIVNMWTGLETLLLVMRLIALFGPLKLFLPTSFLFVLLGVIWGGRYVILGKGLSVAGLLFLLTGIMLFFFGLLTDQIAALRRERYE